MPVLRRVARAHTATLRYRAARGLLLGCLLPLLACAVHATPVRSRAVVTTDPQPPAATPLAVTSEPASAGEGTLQLGLVGDAPYVGVLDRKGLIAIIDQGLGRVLARLKLSAVMRSGRFAGFRVTQIEPAWAAAGIAVGDVLLRLNGQSIERPEQAQEAFESLRVASEVALELTRDEQKQTLRYRVE